MNGLQITPKSEVIDTKGSPIPGLYAIGNVSGSMFFGTYPHELSGISHGRSHTFGSDVRDADGMIRANHFMIDI